MSKEEFLKKNQDKRTKCMVYTRVMGYHRPVESFNLGKKGEHKERKMFDIWYNAFYNSWLSKWDSLCSLDSRVQYEM